MLHVVGCTLCVARCKLYAVRYTLYVVGFSPLESGCCRSGRRGSPCWRTAGTARDGVRLCVVGVRDVESEDAVLWGDDARLVPVVRSGGEDIVQRGRWFSACVV